MAEVLALVRSRILNSTSYCKLISQLNSKDKIAFFSCLLHQSLMDSPPLPTVMEVQTTCAFPHIIPHAKEEVPKIMSMCHCLPSFLDWDACEKFQKSLMRRHKNNTSFNTSLLRVLPEHSLTKPSRTEGGNRKFVTQIRAQHSQPIGLFSFISVNRPTLIQARKSVLGH